ncbi:Zinc metalloproteinase nas-13 [Exaiptasia diaphana]|nr:Zinc metalloproteinase nas-13 [Exaiptasia diaphana]
MPTSNEEYSDIKGDFTEGEEYETVHDRILAINIAHWNRKRTLKQQNKDANLFDKIEKDNEAFQEYLYQGDIQMDEELERDLHMPVRTRTKRNAVRKRKMLWTSRVIPYYIPGFMSRIRKNFMIAIQEFHSKTCLRFVPYQSGVHRNYITFGNKDGCSSMIGKKYYKSGKQTISLGRGCNDPGTIIHETLHALGFFHEQARTDRDKFVKIEWQNILDGFDDQFDKYSWNDIDELGVNYDYKSIMHYGRHAFTKNGQPTLVAIGNERLELGNENGRLSVVDAIEINALYDCKVKRYGWTSWSEYTPCDDYCYKSRERFCYDSGNRRSCVGNVNAYGIEKQEIKCTKMECLGKSFIF